MEIRVIRFMESNQKTMAWYLAEMQKFGYVYDTMWLPHDAKHKLIAANGRTMESIVRSAGYKVQVLERVPVVDSIDAARSIFSKCYFDRINCDQGLQCLRHYRYDVDPETKQFSKNPIHDIYSHGADAFRYLALMVGEPRKSVPKKTNYQLPTNWMN
jgi:phage terminase large subunit